MSLLTQAMLNQVQGKYKTDTIYATRERDLREQKEAANWKMGLSGIKGADYGTKLRSEFINKKYNPMKDIIHSGSGLKLEVPTSELKETSNILDELKQKFWPTAEDYEKIDYTHLIGGKDPSFTEVIKGSLKTKTHQGALIDKADPSILGKTGSLLKQVAPWAASAYSAYKVFDPDSSTASKVGHGLTALYTNPLTSAKMIAGTKALGTAATTGYAAGGLKGATAAVGAKAWASIVALGKTIMAFLPFSDRDLKENIVKVGESDSGLNIYEWNYIGLPDEKYQGVMVDEAPEEARVPLGNTGITALDYAKIDVDFRRVG